MELINEDRKTQNLEPVTLSSVPCGQMHAENMLKYNFLSHWDVNGYKPYLRYTLAGGQGSVTENVAWQRETGGRDSAINLKEALRALEWNMMYNDAMCNWGHRDNILNPANNKVSIGITWDQNNVFFVEDFERDYIKWDLIRVYNNYVTMQGTILRLGFVVRCATVCYDNPNPIQPEQLRVAPYDSHYEPGEPLGVVLPKNWKAKNVFTISASRWTQVYSTFNLCFSIASAISTRGKGVYTIYLQTGKSSADSLTSYSIWVP